MGEIGVTAVSLGSPLPWEVSPHLISLSGSMPPGYKGIVTQVGSIWVGGRRPQNMAISSYRKKKKKSQFYTASTWNSFSPYQADSSLFAIVWAYDVFLLHISFFKLLLLFILSRLLFIYKIRQSYKNSNMKYNLL